VSPSVTATTRPSISAWEGEQHKHANSAMQIDLIFNETSIQN
jgi:hypothetical protein